VKYPKTYKTLEDLPAWNFYKIKEKNDVRYLYVMDDYSELPEVNNVLNDIWVDVQFEYYDLIGLTKEEKQLFEIRKDIVILEAELAITQERFLLNKINRKKKELLKMYENKEGVTLSFEEQIIMLENWRKIPIDSKKITCVRFFTLKKQYHEFAKNQLIKNTLNAH